ncbi:MAG: hypothetical protein H3C34_04100 [Caldilineaceae bacterium]|nr:hypothetical protein [Caldilineaceae bacterium]
MEATEWIDRYVAAVGRLLPERERADVEMEIRSLIQDELEDAGAYDLTETDEETALAVLQKFGKPDLLAARYTKPRYLIGPALYPIFRTVAAVVLSIVAALWLFGATVALGFRGTADNPISLIASLATGLLQSLGTLVLIFGLVEYFTGGVVTKDEKPWDPHTLPPVQAPDRVKVADTVINIGIALALLWVFTAHPDWIVALNISGGSVTARPLLSQTFMAFVPWLSIVWIAEISLGVFVLSRGRWQGGTRLVEIGLSLVTLAILLAMLLDGPLSAWPPLEPVFKLVVAILFTVSAVSAVSQFYRLAMGRSLFEGRGQPRKANSPRPS